ncbi:MAG: Flp pilus assembly complex ATPase component TadA [Phycisphaerae bacterium]|jgi:type IV pilus assembly protein PilB|nr:Flp pilus assembly complex ATPase component TadA [Phycisphaerae bacterium]
MAKRSRVRRKLGKMLLESSAITEDQLETALKLSKGSGKRLGECLIESGACGDVEVSKALAEQFGMAFNPMASGEDLEGIDLSSVPKDVVRKHLVAPCGLSNGRLKLLVHDPMDLELLDLLRFRLKAEIDAVLAPRAALKAYIDEQLGSGAAVASGSLVTESIDVSVDTSVDRSVDASVDIGGGGEESPIVKLVNKLIMEAVRGRASDIHVEPMADRVMLRYRIDGVCHVRDNLPKRMQSALVARLKLLAGVNIAERRIPQDGRIKMEIDGAQVDFRVSACPAYHGESIVLRILRPDSVRIGLPNLGFEPDHLENFNRIIRRPNGIFLVTGPTGSGKTTTLYSALDVLNRPDKKIITAEDPVEYSFAGINQCQVNDGIGLTFPAILRSMLRQAPNIVLIGEIRDREVADIAIQAALTGHLVFSTLHTNDAPSAITRLVDMGVKPYLAASSIQAIMAQRLIRVLCPECAQVDPNPDARTMELVDISPEEADGKVLRETGCGKCGGVGFKGRKAIFEMMTMTTELREMAFAHATVAEMRKVAIRSGMRSLLKDGKVKILNGVTTMQEIARFAQAEVLVSANMDSE